MIDIQNILVNKIGVDKLLHLSFCGWIVSFVQPILWMILVTIVLGIGKELIDLFIRKSAFDYKDMLWTWSGGIITIIIKFLI